MRKILYICLLVLLLASCLDRFAFGNELEVSYEIETVCIDSHCYDLLVERMWAKPIACDSCQTLRDRG